MRFCLPSKRLLKKSFCNNIGKKLCVRKSQTSPLSKLSASGLVVKFNVAIVEPLVRFRACASLR